MPETLETLAEKIGALGKAIEARFAQVDQRFAQVDQRFVEANTHLEKRLAEVQAQLGVKIEALDENVKRVYDVVIAQQARNEANDAAHATFTRRLDDHDLRLLALEPQTPATSPASA